MFGRFTREGKMILTFATQEAADLSHPRLGADHLVLGMLCNARSPLFTLLGTNGLTLAGARAAAEAYHSEHPDDAADKTAEERYEEDRDALRSIGIDLDKIRAAVSDRFGDDLAFGWGERGRGRGRDCGPQSQDWGPRGRGRGRGHHGHPRGQVGPEAFGQRGPGGPGPFGPDGPFGPRGPFGPDGPFGQDGPWAGGRGRRGPRGRGGRPRFTASARNSLAAAVQIAREAGDDQLRPEHLLLGIISVGDPAALAVLNSGTADVDALRAAVEASLPQTA